jgi:hypothetical protein
MKFKRFVSVAVVLSVLTVFSYGQGKGGGGGRGGGGGNAQGFGHGGGGPPESREAEKPRADHPRSVEAPDESKPRRDETPKPNARSAKPAAQELSASMHEINQASFAQRQQLHDTLDMRLKSSREALKRIQSEAKDLRGAARDDFKEALEAVKMREKNLNQALGVARKSREANWEADRGALGRAYRDFDDALHRLESLPRPPRPPLP